MNLKMKDLLLVKLKQISHGKLMSNNKQLKGLKYLQI